MAVTIPSIACRHERERKILVYVPFVSTAIWYTYIYIYTSYRLNSAYIPLYLINLFSLEMSVNEREKRKGKKRKKSMEKSRWPATQHFIPKNLFETTKKINWFVRSNSQRCVCFFFFFLHNIHSPLKLFLFRLKIYQGAPAPREHARSWTCIISFFFFSSLFVSFSFMTLRSGYTTRYNWRSYYSYCFHLWL